MRTDFAEKDTFDGLFFAPDRPSLIGDAYQRIGSGRM